VCGITFGHEVVDLDQTLDVGAMDADRDMQYHVLGTFTLNSVGEAGVE